MELIKPSIGLLFWMLVTFSLLMFVLAKFAWKPILGMLKEREQSIADSLNQANKARAEMANLTAKNEELLNQAKEERSKILQEAQEAAEKIKVDIVAKAQREAEEKLAQALREIDTQKKAAIVEVKNAVGMMALDIAEKVIRKELKTDKDHQNYVRILAEEAELAEMASGSN